MQEILPLRMLIIDDHPIFSWGISALLSSSSPAHSIQVLPIGQDALKWLRMNPADMVLLDLMMPNCDGFQLIQAIRSHCNKIYILVVSSRTDEKAVLKSLHLGANGYIPKCKKASDFQVAIDTIVSGETYLPKEWQELANFAPNAQYNECLPPREKEVLYLISEGKSSKEIAKQLFISEHTIQTYRKRLFKRFEVNTAMELVQAAKLQGFLTEFQL